MTQKTNKTEETPDLSYLEEKITITNLHPFQRQGSVCRSCGGTKEKLFVECKAIHLVCANCGKSKGQEPFLKGKLIH